MGLTVDFNMDEFKRVLEEKRQAVTAATRPAAQEGAQVIYDQVKINTSTIRSTKEHYFYGTAAKAAPKGSKKAKRYGPFVPGSLHSSIYQVYSTRKSSEGLAVYHISWNNKKAPYGGMVEFGTSRAAAQPYLAPAMSAKRDEALQAMKSKLVELVNAA